ncbi:ribokinase [soil metagenome]
MSAPALVAVVGSLNVDRVVPVRSLPEPGATAIGTRTSHQGPGGKGANQAAAAATFVDRAGAVIMIGAVGDDEGADLSLSDLHERGVDVTGVRRLSGQATGHATVALDAHGQNLIVVDPGANAAVTAGDVQSDAVRNAAVTLLQLEIPLGVVLAAAEHAGGMVILNPAPAPAPGDDLAPLFGCADVVVPNRGELAAMLGQPGVGDLTGIADQARALPFDGAVVVTLGKDGALVVAGGRVDRIAAPVALAVDTTGAGDCFCGVLAVVLARGADLLDAVRIAVEAASVSVTGAGARGRLPQASDLPGLTVADV